MFEIKPEMRAESKSVEEFGAEIVATNHSTDSFSLQDMDWKTLNIVDICGHLDVYKVF